MKGWRPITCPFLRWWRLGKSLGEVVAVGKSKQFMISNDGGGASLVRHHAVGDQLHAQKGFEIAHDLLKELFVASFEDHPPVDDPGRENTRPRVREVVVIFSYMEQN